MEAIRNVRLDNICEDIAKERGIMNAAAVEEKELKFAAQQVMEEKKIHAYTHSGVELILRPGVNKLSVKLVDSTGTKATSSRSHEDIVDGSDPAPAEDFEFDDNGEETKEAL